MRSSCDSSGSKRASARSSFRSRRVEELRPDRARAGQPERGDEPDRRHEDAHEAERQLALQAGDEREDDADRDHAEPDRARQLRLVVDAERRDPDQQQRAEQEPHDAGVDRAAPLRGPVDVAQVEGERELVEDEGAADPEDDRERLARQCRPGRGRCRSSRSTRTITTPTTMWWTWTSPIRPLGQRWRRCEPRVQPDQGERQERRAEHAGAVPRDPRARTGGSRPGRAALASDGGGGAAECTRLNSRSLGGRVQSRSVAVRLRAVPGPPPLGSGAWRFANELLPLRPPAATGARARRPRCSRSSCSPCSSRPDR